MRGMVIDTGAEDRNNVAAPVQLMLNALLKVTPKAVIKMQVLTDTETVGRTVDYTGAPDALLAEFSTTGMAGFVMTLHPGGFIMVSPPKSFGSKLSYWRIVGASDEAWSESLLDELIRYPGIRYAAITQEETLDLEELDHVNAHNFPWQHWRLIAARLPET